MSPENVAVPLRVLIAEDNASDAELLVRKLRRNGFAPTVSIVSTEVEFSARLGPDVELVLADYEMGAFSGMRALEIVKERGLDTPFILISGTVGEDIAVEAIKLGASDYLLKDRLARLPVAVEQALEQGRLRRERVRTDAALRLFRTLVDQSSDMFTVIDPLSGRYLDVNEKSCAMIGYTREEHLRLVMWDLDASVSPDEWPRLVARIREAGEEGFMMEGSNRRKDGTTFTVERNARFVTLDRDYIVTISRDITDRKRVERRLLDSERSLAMAQRVAQIGSWQLELRDLERVDANPLQWSDEMFRVFGYAPGGVDVSNETFFAHVHPEDRDKVRAAVSEALRSGTTYRIDHRIIRADRVERILHERAEIVRDEVTGRPLLLVGTAQDVTERRRTAAELRKSREDFRLLFELNPMPMWVYDRETLRFLAVNDSAVRHYGYTRDEFLAMTITEIRPAEEVPLLMSILSAPPTAGLSSAGVWRHRKKNGEIIYAEISFHGFTFQGRPAELILANDVTAQRQNVEALRESEERFRQLAESITEVFWLTDTAKHKMLYVSPAYETIWGRSCQSLYEHPSGWIEAIHPDDRERVLEAIRHQHSGCYHEVYRVVRPDGAIRWVRDRGFPIKDRDGRVYRIAGTAEDITEWRKLEEQFRQAQKLEAIGTLAGGIAHDFNNILGAIIGYVELTKLSLPGNTPANSYLEMVLQAAQRAAALVRQILAFSRQQEQQRVPLQLKQIVAEPLKLLRATIPANIEFDVSLEANLPVVLADPTQVHQVIMNLCTNAAHAMRERPGKLTVRLDRFLMDARTARVGTQLKPGLYVRLVVGDTGCGMDRATMERIFEPFFTTKAPGEGTGLGLAVVHGILESHGGAVAVHSQPGEGTTFTLYFPAEGSSLPDNIKPPERVEVPRGTGERVLFVDDELPLTQLAQSVLETLNYKAVTLTEPTEALRCLKEDPQGYDVLIADLSMPRLMGTDLAKEALAIRPDLPIILITGYSARLTPDVVRSLGIRELLLKPFTFAALGLAVNRVLKGKRG